VKFLVAVPRGLIANRVGSRIVLNEKEKII